MKVYTLVITGLEGHQHTSLTDFCDDADAIESTRTALTAEHRSIAIARGSGDELVFLGAYDLGDDGNAIWTPED